MKTHARVVVIGGGVVGVSTLYHLARKGWSDVVLVERAELTAGSTWHAAGLLPLFNMSYTVGQLHKYSVDLYKRLPAETGQDVSFHVTGNLRLATCRDRMDEYQKYCGTANTIGVPFQVIGPQEVKKLWPLVELGNGADTPNIIGALYHPDDGHIAPADLTMALRKGARAAGAEIHEQTEVTAVKRTRLRRMASHHQQGRHRRRARGVRHRQLRAPDRAHVRHQRALHSRRASIHRVRRVARTQGLPARAAAASSRCCASRISPTICARSAWAGYSVPYEAGAPARFADGVPDWFGKSLFEGDLERLLPHVEAAQRRVPSLANCGIKDIVNGPIAYTPDGSPLIGPAWGVRNLWLNEGHSFGITAAGGSGWQLAEWIVEGEPGIDMMAVDPRRYGPYTSKRYVVQKNEETYRNVFVIHYPGRGAARCAPGQDQSDLRQAQAHGRGVRPALRLGARQLVRARRASRPKDQWSFRRSNYFEHVGREALLIRRARRHDRSLTPFTKHEVTGPGAEAWLDGLVANKVPTKIGRIALCHALTRRGGIRSEFTITKIAEQHLLRGERRRRGALRQRLFAADAAGNPAAAAVTLRNITTSRGCFVLAGPRSREVLAKLTDVPLDNAAFPWLTGQVAEVGPRDRCVPAAREFRRRARLGTALPHRVRASSVRRDFRGRRRIQDRHGGHARHGIACGSKNPTACGAAT